LYECQIYYCAENSPPLLPNLSQINPVQALPIDFKIHCNIIRSAAIGQSVGIATRYGINGSGIKSRLERRDFPYPSQPSLESNQPPVQLVPGLFTGVKRPECGANHPPPSSSAVKERVEIYSPSGNSRLAVW